MEINAALTSAGRGLPGKVVPGEAPEAVPWADGNRSGPRSGAPLPGTEPSVPADEIWAREQQQFPVLKPPRPLKRPSPAPPFEARTGPGVGRRPPRRHRKMAFGGFRPGA